MIKRQPDDSLTNQLAVSEFKDCRNQRTANLKKITFRAII